MKNILIPTDFSANAKNAFQYIKDMNEDIESDLTVLHVYHPTADPNQTFYVMNIDELGEDRKTKLNNFVHAQDAKGMEEVITAEMVEQKLQLGFAAEQIVAISKTNEYDLIAMSTSGSGGILNKIFGSVSIDVAQKSDCPVWLIPPTAKYKKIKKILYASNYASSDQEMVNEVIGLADEFDADIRFVHVNETKNKGDYEMEELLLEQIFRKEAPALEFRVNTVQSNSAWEGLYQYAEEEGIDLIVLATKHRKFLENLFHQSLTKKMLLKSKQIPLLVLHSKAK